MAEVELKVGAKLNLLSQQELDHSLSKAAKEARAIEYERLRGVKPMRFIFYGTPASSAVEFGGDSGDGQLQGPESGFAWSVRFLCIEGLTASASAPDVINILRGGAGTSGYRLLWQLNGNVFSQTWGRGEMILNAGETLYFTNLGTLAATNSIVAHGLAENVPGEMIGKFY